VLRHVSTLIVLTVQSPAGALFSVTVTWTRSAVAVPHRLLVLLTTVRAGLANQLAEYHLQENAFTT